MPGGSPSGSETKNHLGFQFEKNEAPREPQVHHCSRPRTRVEGVNEAGERQQITK